MNLNLNCAPCLGDGGEAGTGAQGGGDQRRRARRPALQGLRRRQEEQAGTPVSGAQAQFQLNFQYK